MCIYVHTYIYSYTYTFIYIVRLVEKSKTLFDMSYHPSLPWFWRTINVFAEKYSLAYFIFVYFNRFRDDGEAIGFGNTALIIFIWRSTWELFQRPMIQLGEWFNHKSTSENSKNVTR